MQIVKKLNFIYFSVIYTLTSMIVHDNDSFKNYSFFHTSQSQKNSSIPLFTVFFLIFTTFTEINNMVSTYLSYHDKCILYKIVPFFSFSIIDKTFV